MRKDFIDNLRIMCILLLFPFHTFMIYNNWGEAFYIHGESLQFVSIFNGAVYPWWMTLLFTLAGISSAYALKRRTAKKFLTERVKKLLIPLLTALLLIIPAQSYIADCFHYHYSGNFFTHYLVFFTKLTDLSGYDGGFTPAHTWFLLYLFIISVVMLPLMNWYTKREKKINCNKVNTLMLLPYFLVILLLTPLIELGGKSLTESLACFAIGFFILCDDSVQERLEKNVLWLSLLFVLSIGLRFFIMNQLGDDSLIFAIEQRIVTWFGILAFMAIGKKFFNKHNSVTKYLSGASFSLYYFHQTFVVIIGFFALQYIGNTVLQIVVIMVGAFLLSIACYELFRRFRLTSFLFGIKNKDKSTSGKTL